MMRRITKTTLAGLVVMALFALPQGDRGIAYGESFKVERDDRRPWCGTTCCTGTDCCTQTGCCCP